MKEAEWVPERVSARMEEANGTAPVLMVLGTERFSEDTFISALSEDQSPRAPLTVV